LRFIVSLSLTGKNRGTPHDAQEETSTRKPKQSPAQEAGSRMDDGVAAASCEGVGRSTAVGSAVAALMLIFLKKNPSFGVEEMETWKCFMQSESQKLLITLLVCKCYSVTSLQCYNVICSVTVLQSCIDGIIAKATYYIVSVQ